MKHVAPGFRGGLLPGLMLSAGVLATAWAAGGSAPSTAGTEAPFLSENRAVMTRMMQSMAIEPSGDVDRDFVAMMVPHHQGAIDMAMAVLRYGHNERIRRLAQEIIVTQQQEIVAMRLAVGERLPAAAAPAASTGGISSAMQALRPHRGMDSHDMHQESL